MTLHYNNKRFSELAPHHGWKTAVIDMERKIMSLYKNEKSGAVFMQLLNILSNPAKEGQLYNKLKVQLAQIQDREM